MEFLLIFCKRAKNASFALTALGSGGILEETGKGRGPACSAPVVKKL